MEKLMQQDALALPGVVLQIQIEDDETLADICSGVRRIARRIPQIGGVANFNRAAVK
ncbi:MAG TPA: hypothetical protein VG273_10745 [Bryobacteraceae bacterium]|jgi:hypothetical protein|nr:hypothetical protein [Bryobacteraceae bacterium]